MKTTTVFAFVLLMISAGCFYGDRYPERRTVSVSFPTPQTQSKVTASISDSEVQEALKLVGAVLLPEGFVRDENPVGASGQGLVASYAKYNGTGPRPIGGPSVYFKGDLLKIVFVQGGGMNERITPETEKNVSSLRNELTRRYGVQRVSVE